MNDKNILKYKIKLKRMMNETDNIIAKHKKEKHYKNKILNTIKEKYLEDDDSLSLMKRSVSTEDNEKNNNDRNVLLGNVKEQDEPNVNTNKQSDNQDNLNIDNDENDTDAPKNDFNLEKLNQEDLEDLANDTMLDVLQHIKDLREKMKKENPEKAKFIRKIYDYLVKGKDKIATDIIKETQKEDIINNE